MLTELLTSPAVWVIVPVVAAGWLVPAFIRWRKRVTTLNNLPGIEDTSCIWGNLHVVPKGTGPEWHKYMLGLVAKNQRLCRFWIGPFRAVVFLFHPDTCKVILQGSEPKPLGFGDPFKLVMPWLGRGLLTSDGEPWYQLRHLLTPAFHFDILRPYMNVYNKAADLLCENIDKYADTGESFDIYPLLKLCTFDIILKCAMSLDLDIQRTGKDSQYLKDTERLITLWGERITNPLYFSDTLYRMTVRGEEFFKCCDAVHAFAEDVINKRRQQLEKEDPPQKQYLDLIDILLTAKDESGQGLSVEEIRAEVDTFLFAGYETSSTATSWLLHLLAENPGYQVRVQEEIETAVGGKSSTDVAWADLSKLELLTCCMKEALRLYPPVPASGRITTKDTQIDGVSIPHGTRLVAMYVCLHRNPAVWEQPDEFIPERFGKEQAKDRDPFAFAPFSAGPRNCIGQVFASNEIRVMAAKVLQRFDLTPDPNHPVVPNSASVLHSESGIWVFANRRILWH